MDEILITDADLDLAFALENTLTVGDLVDPSTYLWQDIRLVIETPDGYRAVGGVSYDGDFIVLTVLE